MARMVDSAADRFFWLRPTSDTLYRISLEGGPARNLSSDIAGVTMLWTPR